MKVRKLAALGDYSFGNNSQDYIKSYEALGQIIRTKVLLFYGEWWEDLGLGIPMFQSFLGQPNNENTVNALRLLLAKRVKEIQQVKSVENIEIEQDGRRTYITLRVTSTMGEEIETEVEV